MAPNENSTNPSGEQPTIKTTHGSVRGYVRTTVYDDQFYCFESIPYAKPPLAELRFKSPVEVEPWQGVLDCTELANKSLQYNRYTKEIEGGEDCLYLNIYAKQLQSDKPLPVMVYLHGGGFNTGDATRLSWGPDYFMMRDVIFVTIGYRLGPLGFLTLTDPALKVPGNAGMKDVILALKWIKKNVAKFNGDADNITLFGHSSGGCATHLLMVSEQARGLFHKAILMAGFSFDMARADNLEYRLARTIGYEGENDERQIYEFLMSVEANKLVGFDFWTQEEKDQGYFYAFMAHREPYETPDSIFTEKEVVLQRRCWSNNIPLMLGTTSQESLIAHKRFSDPAVYELYREHPEYLLTKELTSHINDLAVERKFAAKLQELHFAGKPLCVESINEMIDMSSHGIYHAAHRMLLSRLAHSTAPNYFYRFDFDSPTFNLYRIKHCGPDIRGVGHVDELSYIFYMPQSFKLDRNSAEFKTILRMVDMWTAFAARSDPNTQSISPVVWRPEQRFGARKCLNISHDVSFIAWPPAQACSVWDDVYAEAGVQLI